MSVYITCSNRMALKCNGPWCGRTFHPRREVKTVEALRALACRQAWRTVPWSDGESRIRAAIRGGALADYCSDKCAARHEEDGP